MSGDYIFLSYSHKDTDKIRPVIDWLESTYYVWYDKNLGAAREYNEEIADQIRNARIVIAFFSTPYMESPYCRDEIMYARTKGVEILGILIDEVQMSEGMQLRLGRFQMLNFIDSIEYDKIIANKLVNSCRKDAVNETLLQNLQNSFEERKIKQLPRMLFATDFEGKNVFSQTGQWKETGAGSLRVPIGLRQDMDTDEITEAYYDTAYGHQYIYGSTMSGKSTVLQTISLQLMENNNPDEVQFYYIDFGNYMMELFQHSPHVGDVMNRDDKAKIKRFFLFIEKELKRRIRFFKNGSYAAYSQKYGAVCPIILIVIDGLENFWEEYLVDEENQGAFKAILREGMRAGILFLIGKGTTAKTVYGITMDNVRTLAALGYERWEDYEDVFQGFTFFNDGIKKRIKQENFESPGKGMLKSGKKMFILQSALPIDVAEDYDRYEALIEKCKEMKRTWRGDSAKKVPTIPEHFIAEELLQMSDVRKTREQGDAIPIGLNYYSAEPMFLQLKDDYIYPIVGEAASGKSNLLRLFMKEADLQNWKSIIIDPKNVHKSFTEKMNVVYLGNEEDVYNESWNLYAEVDKRNKRKTELTNLRKEDVGELIREEFGPVGIFIEGLSPFYDLLSQQLLVEKNVTALFRNLLEKGRNLGIYFFITIDSKNHTDYQPAISGMTQMIKDRCGQGIYIGGNIIDDRWFGFDWPTHKSIRCNLESEYGKGTALLVSKSGVNKEQMVKIPVVKMKGRTGI